MEKEKKCNLWEWSRWPKIWLKEVVVQILYNMKVILQEENFVVESWLESVTMNPRNMFLIIWISGVLCDC